MAMQFQYKAVTDTGRQRELNEDSILTRRPTGNELLNARGDLLVVADGMGGHQSGEVASSIAVATIADTYYQVPSNDPGDALRQAIEAANNTIYQRAKQEGRQGMGTTVVAAAHVGDVLYVAHVGDSRAYCIRKNEIKQLTRDHSLVAAHVEAGLISPEEAAHHPHRNVISRAVGTGAQVEVELSQFSPVELMQGDVIVLCSDGLTEHVSPARIMELVNQSGNHEQAAMALITEANNNGGSDNISVIVARVGATGAGSQSGILTVPEKAVEGLTSKPNGGRAKKKQGNNITMIAIVAALLLVLLTGGAIMAYMLMTSPAGITSSEGGGTTEIASGAQNIPTTQQESPPPTASQIVPSPPIPTNGGNPLAGVSSTPSPLATTLAPSSTARATDAASPTPTRAPATATSTAQRATPIPPLPAALTQVTGQNTTPDVRETPVTSNITPTSTQQQPAPVQNVTLTLLNPEPNGTTSDKLVSFQVRADGYQVGTHQLFIMMGTDPNNPNIPASLTRSNFSNGVWVGDVTSPPGNFGTWYWTARVIDNQGTIVAQASEVRRFEWNAPPLPGGGGGEPTPRPR